MDNLIDEKKLKMKEIIEKYEPDHGWRLTNFGMGPYAICLDDGSQTYCSLNFDKNEYTQEDIIDIANELASFLGIENRISLK